MKVGILGLPNAGKSSLFNALTRAGAQAANYPFTTVEPNVAVVPVPDERLDAVVDTIKATPTVYETIEFHDIAGLVRGAHKGEGLGNRFLGNIRETDALVHVVRAHDDAQVVHPEGRVDPLADIETVETELLYADLEQAERRLEKVTREAKSVAKDKVAEEAWLRELVAALGEGRPARTVPAAAAAPDAMRNLQPLTSKPVLYLANVGEGDSARAAGGAGRLRARAGRAGGGGVRAPGGGAGRARRRRGRLDAGGDGRRRVGPGHRGARGVGAARADLVLHRRRGQGGARLGDRARHARAPRGRAGCTPTSSAASWRPRWCRGRTSWRPAATRRRASGRSCASRAATTRCATAT